MKDKRDKGIKDKIKNKEEVERRDLDDLKRKR